MDLDKLYLVTTTIESANGIDGDTGTYFIPSGTILRLIYFEQRCMQFDVLGRDFQIELTRDELRAPRELMPFKVLWQSISALFEDN